MPTVIPAFGFAVGSSIGGSLATGFAGKLLSVGIGGALQSLSSQALFNQRIPSFSSDTGAILSNRDGGTNTHSIIYGKRRVGGTKFLETVTSSGNDSDDETVNGNNQFYHLCLALAGHECDSIDEIYFGDDLLTIGPDNFVTNDKFVKDGKKYMKVVTRLGSDDQLAIQDIVNDVPFWTSDHRARGVCYVYIRLQYDKDVMREAKSITCLIKGKKVYDPRSSTTEWSENPSLIASDYLQADFGFNVDSSEVDDASVIAAANISDEQVQKQDLTNENRYTCNIVLDTAEGQLDNLDQIVSSMIGKTPYSQGTFKVHAGAYDVPTVTVDEDMLVSAISVTPNPARQDLFNAIKGVYIDSSKKYVSTDFSAITNETYETEDGGERIYKDVFLGAVVGQERAQRIAKIMLQQSRFGMTVEIQTNWNALQLTVWDTVMLTSSDLGFSNKVFRIIRWQLSSDGKGITLSLKEEDSSAYNWSSGDATVLDPGTLPTLPNPFDVTPPGSPQITEEEYISNNAAGVKSRAIVTWAASNDAFIRDYQLEYKLTSESSYVIAGKTNDPSFVLNDLTPGQYNFRVKAINELGAESDYSPTIYNILGLTDLPSDITNFSLNAINNNAHLSWDLATDIDVLVGGKVVIKHSNDTGSPSWSSAIQIAPSLPGNTTHAVVPLIDGTYMIKAVDSTGNESDTEAIIESTLVNIVDMNTVLTSTQNPGFTGSKTNLVVNGGILSLDGTGFFDDEPGLFDSVSGLFDFATDIHMSGSYEFDTYVDVGKVMVSRITSNMESIVSDTGVLFDETPGDFDDMTGKFDGGPYSGASNVLYIRTTDDDPSGSPTWSDWRTFIVGEYNHRAYEFKLEISTNNSSLNIDVSELGVELDVPDKTEEGAVSTSTGGLSTINYSKTFYSTPKVGATITNGATGDYVIISNETSSSFDAGVKDSGGSFISKNLNWIAKGH